MKLISIDGPVFYSQEDEEIFFDCIQNLPDFKNVNGAGRQLNIYFNNEVSELAIKKINIICKRWQTKLSD